MFVLIISISSKPNIPLMEVTSNKRETGSVGVGEDGLWSVMDQSSVWMHVKENCKGKNGAIMNVV